MNKRQKLVQAQFLNNEEAVIRRLKQVYNQAQKNIEKKTQALQDDISRLGTLANLAADDEEKAKFLSMQQSKIYQKQYQDAMKKQIGSVLDNMQVEEFKTVSEYLTKCYEDGFVGTMFDLQGQGIPLCFPMDQEAMVRAVQLDSKISQGLYSRLGEDVALLKKKITAEVSRGIATGMSFQQVAKQLAGHTNIGYNNAVRIARTEGHRIQVQGAMDACYKAKDKGADVVKQWDSTLDSRTRESHQAVDGEIRELDKKFSNGLMFPGDPSGGAAEVVNCRCALLQRARWALDEDELQTLKDRAEYFGLDKTKDFEEYKTKYIASAKMASDATSKNDWSGTVSRQITKAEKQELISYASERGIKIPDLNSFDGDTELLKMEIDTISKMAEEFPIGRKITVSVSQSMPDEDFASTIGEHITFNAKALRNRKITEQNIVLGDQFASSCVEDIAAHEYGHIISTVKGNKGLEISGKAYYNVFGKTIEDDDLIDFLDENISNYSTTVKNRKYTEITPEMLAKNNSKPDAFTEEFIKLLKGACFNEET